jgi:hypothetical protein
MPSFLANRMKQRRNYAYERATGAQDTAGTSPAVLLALGTSLVGANREAVTRAFGELRSVGGTEIRDRHIQVTDTAAVERLADALR